MKKTAGLPQKWNYLEFLSELINNFMGWTSDDDDDDALMSSNTPSAAASVAGLAAGSVSSSRWKYNFATKQGRMTFFDENSPTPITVSRMNGTHFMCRNDGKYHPMLPTVQSTAYCQYCKYKWKHELTEVEKVRSKSMSNNRNGIQRCLECNVNLCVYCANEWHGFGFGKINALFNE